MQVQLGIAAVSIDDFFTENLVSNLADLLGIDQSLIRIVNIVRENSRRKRRSSADVVIVQVEIADPPLAANGSSSSNYTGMETGFLLFFFLRFSRFLCCDLAQDTYCKRASHKTRILKGTILFSMFSIKELKPTLNKQCDSIRTKLFA